MGALFVLGTWAKYNWIYASVLLFAMGFIEVILPRILVYLELTMTQCLLIAFVLIFVFCIVGYTYQFAYDIRHENQPKLNIHFINNSNSLKNSVFERITSNSQYMFLYNIKSDKVIIVPTDNIDSIEKQ